MGKELKAVMVGIGNTGMQAVEYMVQHGVTIVGAVDVREELFGKKLTDVVETEVPEIVISNQLKETLQETRPDIAVICTVSLLEDLYETAYTCLECGVNVITTAEKAFCPGYNPNKELVTSLDKIAKEKNVTMYASGVQDVLWVSFALTLSSLCNKVDRIHGVNYALIDGFGPLCLEEAFVGKKPEEFSQGEVLNDDFNYALWAIAEALDLEPTDVKTEVSPLLAKEDVYSEIADVKVQKGDIIGVKTNTTILTKEGMTLSADFYEKLTEPGETGKNEWSVEGTPNLTIKMDEMYGDYTTCTTLVNRIPDVINAKPGYLSPAEMPAAKFRAKEFGNYI